MQVIGIFDLEECDKHKMKWVDRYTLPIAQIYYPGNDIYYPEIEGMQFSEEPNGLINIPAQLLLSCIPAHGGYSKFFKWQGWLNGDKNQNPKKSLD